MENQEPTINKLELEVENLKKQNEKLAFEIEDLRSEKPFTRNFSRLLPILTWLITAIALPGAIFKYVAEQKSAREYQAKEQTIAQERQEKEILNKREADIRANELFLKELTRDQAKQLWDKQLSLYIEAVENAAVLSTSDDPVELKKAESRFWVLYWGPLAAVEDIGRTNIRRTKSNDAPIETRMVEFGELLGTNQIRDKGVMKQVALKLSHSIRQAIGFAFDVETSDQKDFRAFTPLERWKKALDPKVTLMEKPADFPDSWNCMIRETIPASFRYRANDRIFVERTADDKYGEFYYRIAKVDEHFLWLVDHSRPGPVSIKLPKSSGKCFYSDSGPNGKFVPFYDVEAVK